MSYVKSVLQPGERIIFAGRLHWIAYWQAVLFLIVGIALVWWEYAHWPNQNFLISVTAVIFGALFLVSFLRAWFVRWITEIAVTDRRVIYKRGFINRHTAEMNMDKVASVEVDQSVLGRMLDYGTVHVLGTGGAQGIDSKTDALGIEHLHRIASPLALRNAIIAK
jgi:uncharacterized membrane protein YdbT with pleckstrin-like domain